MLLPQEVDGRHPTAIRQVRRADVVTHDQQSGVITGASRSLPSHNRVLGARLLKNNQTK